jgi:hypothetical protein
MKVVLPTWNNLTNQAFEVHSIGQYMGVVFSSWNTHTKQALGNAFN